MKNDLLFVDDSRLRLESSADGRRHTLSLDPSVASDAGLYTCVACNVLGQATASSRVVLGDIADSPDSPTVEAMTDTDVLLAWRTPARLNHTPVICYKVQMGYIGEKPSLFLLKYCTILASSNKMPSLHTLHWNVLKLKLM